MGNKKTMQAGNGGARWRDYVDDMRDQKPEQYLAGDIIVALVWFTLGVFVGSVL